MRKPARRSSELPSWVHSLIQDIRPDDPLRRVFFERGVRALQELSRLEDDDLSMACAEPTDLLMLLRALDRSYVLEAAGNRAGKPARS